MPVAQIPVELQQIEITEGLKFRHANFQVKEQVVYFPKHFPTEQVSVGIDPGKAWMGIAVQLNRCTFGLYQFHLFAPNKEAVLGCMTVRMALAWMFGMIPLTLSTAQVTIEGSSYGERYGQTVLAEARITAALYLHDLGAEVRIVPPLSVRKTVFGSGKIHADKFWPVLYADAANALACALQPFYEAEVLHHAGD